MRPREIAVVSGKGGTGKTTVTAMLARALSERCVICDADVDAPDLWILLKPVVQREDLFVGGHKAQVNTPPCDGCGLCSRHCRFKAITMTPSGAHVDPTACEGCGVCSILCPKGAVELLRTKQGHVFESQTSFGPMFHAKLNPGGENSGRLVQILRERARKSAGELRKEWILLDGPPGIACPAISALTGASLGLIITEPSKSGLHDLLRLLEVTRQLRVPSGVVINRWDLSQEGSNRIRQACEDTGTPVLAEIPFQEEVVRDLSMGNIPSSIPQELVDQILQGIQRITQGE
ncbi:P-loop ATPase, MinD superfamily [Thermanaerovibrio velox DSM 12556]|uniref:p-loop ATPase, MinD superfamily n=1 Tax=Thermanaerovibrio velox DSM 12556 TaxID=926567 RepID=H0UMR4_9BACT|nr:ATP-binding protein [Thermanaerovibrio velox]EHM09209.1 P-loop ATPase, MinD superfamily [Thermanaerovibrio velox DSM 12556]